MADVFRRSGRGGAGNFWSKKEVEEVEKRAAAQDLESQKHNTPTTHDTDTALTYARAGRGGAGNFHDPSTLPDDKTVGQVAEKTLSAVAASLTKPKVGWSGRGGAGNYLDAPSAAQEAEQTRMAALEQKVLLDVEAGLAPPPKAHTGAQKTGSA